MLLYVITPEPNLPRELAVLIHNNVTRNPPEKYSLFSNAISKTIQDEDPVLNTYGRPRGVYSTVYLMNHTKVTRDKIDSKYRSVYMYVNNSKYPSVYMYTIQNTVLCTCIQFKIPFFVHVYN